MARFCSATILRSWREYCGFFSSTLRRDSAVGESNASASWTVKTRRCESNEGCVLGWHHTFAVLLRIQRCIQQLGDLDVCCHADLDLIENGLVKLQKSDGSCR